MAARNALGAHLQALLWCCMIPALLALPRSEDEHSEYSEEMMKTMWRTLVADETMKGELADQWRLQLKQLVRQAEREDHAAVRAAPQRKPATRESFIGTRDLTTSNGYPVEEFTVRTEDGYLLGGFRVPQPGGTPVLLMHGVLSSSADYVLPGRGKALALLMHDAGLDVWMCNARGTTPSRRHEHLKPNQAAFWDFSWHEIGERDLPACIDHVLAATNQTALHYVGHSQGTTAFFVLGSERPEYMAKVKTFTAMAPVAFLRDVRSIPIKLTSVTPNALGALLRLIGANEFMPHNAFLTWIGNTFCADGHITQPVCSNAFFLICGFDSQQLNKTMLPQILAHTPAGASTKQLIHFGQLVRNSKLEFKKYDYGWFRNMGKYHSHHPPEYDLSKVTALTYLVHADNDLLSVESNVQELQRRLPNIAPDGVRRVAFAKFNHLDYLYAIHAKELVYDDIIRVIQEHEETSQAGF